MLHIFIINPYAGKQKFAEGVREHLSKMDNLNYFVFNTRYAGYENELITRLCNIFEGEKLRFYCCGGSGTIRNIVNALGDNIDKVEVAFFPCGHTNDYLKIYGSYEKLFYKLDNLIYGKAVDIDYIKTNRGIALNTFSGGIDAIFMDGTNQNKELWDVANFVANTFAFLKTIIFSKFVKYHIEIDGKVFEKAYIELIFGKGTTFGGILKFANSSKINDGLCHYILAPYGSVFKRFGNIYQMFKGRIDKLHRGSDVGMCSKMTIRRQDNKPFAMNYDGELLIGTEFEMEVVKKGLKMVIPREVSIDG